MQTTKRAERANRRCDQCRQRRCRCDREAGKSRCAVCEEEGNECTFLYGPTPRKAQTLVDQPRARNTARGTLSSTLASPVKKPTGVAGLENLHSEYISPSSYHEPALLDLKPSHLHSPVKQEGPRRADKTAAFITYSDENPASNIQRIAELDKIEEAVRPLGPTLVKLYFNIVHLVFPILHKDAFLEKYARSYQEFSPPLLAGVYLIALDWQVFDREPVAASRTPDAAMLENLAMRAMENDLKRPKLSTLQAGLLLLQRARRTANTLPAQLVALGQTLGIHVDCSDWAIPEWKKGLRRRLAWALYM